MYGSHLTLPSASLVIGEDPNLSEAIIDDELLSNLHDNKAKNVPYAAKNKKQLQTKLEQRGFEKEAIERLLSL